MNPKSEDGFTLVELLVTIVLFSVLSAGFYSVMLSGVRGSDTTESVVRISEEARFGLNRMVRDTREATRLTAASPTSYTIEIDFNANGTIEPANGEVETFAYDSNRNVITLNGEVLVAGVKQVAVLPIFDYSSNQLQFDHNPVDGIATWQEVNNPPASVTGGGDRDPAPTAPDGPELPYLTEVSFVLRIESGDRASEFYSLAQLRNARTERR